LKTRRLGGREARMLGGYEDGKLVVEQALVLARLEFTKRRYLPAGFPVSEPPAVSVCRPVFQI